MIKPPEPFADEPRPFVFLAGSIEMGDARKWQQEIFEALSEDDVTLLNPRRDDWDSSWIQSIENDVFREQVQWELSGLEQADIIALYLEPNTQSPISLLELGLHATSGKLIVCCPDGFERKGNVDIVCRHHNIEQATDLPDLAHRIRTRLTPNW